MGETRSSREERKGELRVELENRKEGGRVAFVVLDHQQKLNAVNTPLLEKLAQTFHDLKKDARLRVTVLTGAGRRAFIGGADINEMVEFTPDTGEAFITLLHGVCEAIRNLPVPVIARISGYCLGGGLEIAASCDLRLATKDAQFGMPEVLVGLPSVIEACLLPRLMGWGKARALIYTGRSISSAEALQCGLVDKVVAAENLDQALEDWIEAILNAGPKAIRLQKALIRQWEELPINEAVQAGIKAFRRSWESEEPRRLMQTFLCRPRK
jgi:enoyl-CoA hydratase/carnithine racemase